MIVFPGLFGHYGVFWVILGFFSVFWSLECFRFILVIMVFPVLFWSFWSFWGYFCHFRGSVLFGHYGVSRVNLVIFEFWGLSCLL